MQYFKNEVKYMVLEQGQVLTVKEKITYLPPDEWLKGKL